MRGTPGPAPRSPRSRDGRASSAAQRSRSPRRTSRGGPRQPLKDAATQTPWNFDITAASSGAEASGAEVVPDVPSHFGRVPQPYSHAGIHERHDITTGHVPDQDILEGPEGTYYSRTPQNRRESQLAAIEIRCGRDGGDETDSGNETDQDAVGGMC